MDARTADQLAAEPLSPADIRSIFYGIMLAMFLSALDGTIVATAMPTIGRELRDLDHLPWVVTSYLLASTAVTPLYGKFSDLHGRRPTMLIGIAVFLLGSVASALAPTMLVLIIGRAVQGLGGGGLIALAQTIVADMVTPRERGRYQVYFGAVFASASLLGPVLGGLMAENLHWSVIFWINVPLGLLALWLVNDKLKKLPRPGVRHRLDIVGAILMTGATVSLMLALSWGGVRFPWLSGPIAATLALSVVLWFAFVARLRTASEPLIPLAILQDRVVGTAVAASASGMGTYIGLTIFVPIYFETVLGFSARESGLAVIPFMIGMVIGATSSGRAMARLTHYKRTPLAGLSLAFVSLILVALFAGRMPFPALEFLLFLVSVGTGTLMPVATVAMQNAVEPRHLGTATAGMNFARQLAGAIIVAAFGALALGGHSEGARVTLETLSRGGNMDLNDTFRSVFAVAAFGLGVTLAVFAVMEERPFRDRRPAAGAVVEQA